MKIPHTAWSAKFPDGRVFDHQAFYTRQDVFEHIGALFDSDVKLGWKKAYRRGYRVIKVGVLEATE